MNIQLEDYKIDSAYLTVDVFVDGVYKALQFLIGEFEVFAEQNGFLEWSHAILKEQEHVDDAYGTMTFETYCREYICEADVHLFVEWKLKLAA